MRTYHHMLKQELNRYYRLLSPALQSRPSKILFLLCLFFGFIVSFLFHKPPVILIFAFAAWTLWGAVTVLLHASIDLLNRKMFAALCGFLFGVFIAGVSYLGWKLLFEVF